MVSCLCLMEWLLGVMFSGGWLGTCLGISIEFSCLYLSCLVCYVLGCFSLLFRTIDGCSMPLSAATYLASFLRLAISTEDNHPVCHQSAYDTDIDTRANFEDTAIEEDSTTDSFQRESQPRASHVSSVRAQPTMSSSHRYLGHQACRCPDH